MSKNRNKNNHANYNQPDPDLSKVDQLPEDVEEPTLNIKPEDNVFIPNSLVYNAYGVAPTTATYRLLVKDLKDMFERVCKDQIDGVDHVGASFDPTTGDVQFSCVFEENCRHFTDRSMENTMCSDQKNEYFSKEVLTFAKKFGLNPALDCPHDKNGKVLGPFAKYNKDGKDMNVKVLFVRNLDNSNNYTNGYSMRLSWTTMIRLIFDETGAAFYKQFGKRPSRCKLSAHFEFAKDGEHVFGKVLYLEVIKTINGLSGNTQKPKTAFNYREA